MIEPIFVPITKDNINLYLNALNKIVFAYKSYLFDDYLFCKFGKDGFYSLILEKSPYFWVIKSGEDFAGFVFLDEFTGNDYCFHSAEISVCFLPKFWGKFTRLTGEKFFKHCFKNLKLVKIKACIYPENNRVRGLLKDCGFKFEGLLRAQTIRKGKLQDIEIFGLINPNYA